MHAPEQTSLVFAPAAPPIFAPAPAAPADPLTLKPYAPWTRATFLHNVRAHSLRRADELEAIARDFKGLPATAGIMLLGETGVPINLPAFVPSPEWRAEGFAHAAKIRAVYADPLWMARELARWEMTGAENPQPARRAA
jgi:hypothetical protein